MHLANRAIRLVTGMVATAAIALTLGASAAGAAVAAPVGTTPHSTTAAVTTAKPQVPATPSGCNNGNLCEYNSGNGGNLCFQTNRSETWPGGCAAHNEGEYDRNGNAVYMFGYNQYGACTYLLYSGHYLLYNANDHFQNGAKNCTSLTLEHRLLSSQFT